MMQLTHAFQLIWQASLASTPLILAVLLVKRLAGARLTAKWNYCLWSLVAVRLVLLRPLLVFGHSAPPAFPAYSFDLASPSAALTGAVPSSVQPAAIMLGSRALPVGVLAVVWFCGVLLVGAVLLLSHFAFLRKLGREQKHELPDAEHLLAECKRIVSVKREVAVMACSGTSTPTLFNVFKPTILVPDSSWSRLQEDEQKFILLHELVHVQRYDLYTNWWALLMQSVYWFNPLVWLAGNSFRLDREMSCDEQVLNFLDASERLQYAATILSLVERIPRPRLLLGAAGFAGGKFIQRRIKMIAGYKKHSKRISALLVALVVVLGTVAFVSAAGIGQTPPIARWMVTSDAVLHQVEGQGWLNVTPTGIPSINGCRNFFLDGDHGWLLPVTDATIGSVYRTSDGGKSWTSSALPEGINGGNLFFVNANSGWLLTGLDAGMSHEPVAVSHTADGGATWAIISRTTNDSVGQLPSAGMKSGISFVTEQRGYVTGFLPTNGRPYLYRSDDGGLTWQEQILAVSSSYTNSQMNTYPPVFFGDGQGVLPVEAFDVDRALFFFITKDSGTSWTAGAAIIHQDGSPSFVWSFADASHGFVTDGQNLYSSIDGGQTWARVQTNLQMQEPSKLIFVSPQAGFILGENVLQTTDGGLTWAPLSK